MISIVGLAAGCLVSTLGAGKIAIFTGATSGPGDVLVFDESGGPPVLAIEDLRLLPIDFAGRTSIEELLPDRPRLHADVPAAARLALPSGGSLQGSLYRYVRKTPLGASVHGFLLTDASGARSLFELAEPCRGCDPFVPRIAVAPAGDAILVATLPIAGGDLYELDLATGLATNRTAGVAPVAFNGSGLALSSQWGVAAGATGVWRFDRSSAGDAQAVAFQPQPPWFAGELVLSRNGEWAATIAGDEQALAYPWIFSSTGAPVRMSSLPAPLSGAGFLPEATDGPWLAVSDDGTSCAWRTEIDHAYTTEVYFAQVSSNPSVPVHVTEDANFAPYIDEVGQFLFGLGNRLLFSAGDPPLPGQGGLSRMDYFELTPLPGSAISLRNLSNTSGQSVPPFLDYPKLEPSIAIWWPASGTYLLHDEAYERRLLAVQENSTGVQQLAEEMLSLALVGSTPSGLVSFLESEEEEETGIYCALPPEGGLTQLLELPQGSAFLRGTLAAQRWLAWLSVESGSEKLRRLDLQQQTLELLSDRPLAYGPTLALTAAGTIAFSLETGTNAQFFLWPPSTSPKRLATPYGPGFLLP